MRPKNYRARIFARALFYCSFHQIFVLGGHKTLLRATLKHYPTKPFNQNPQKPEDCSLDSHFGLHFER